MAPRREGRGKEGLLARAHAGVGVAGDGGRQIVADSADP